MQSCLHSSVYISFAVISIIQLSSQLRLPALIKDGFGFCGGSDQQLELMLQPATVLFLKKVFQIHLF